MSIELLDSITAEKLLSAVDEKQLLPNDTNQNKMKENENCFKKKKQRQQKYIYLLDKPLEKILIRYNNNKVTLFFHMRINCILIM